MRMKRMWIGSLALLLVGLTAATARAQNVSPADKEKALKYLETTRKGVEEATKGLSEAQWNFKPGPDRWSVAQVTEHIAAAEDLLRGWAEKQMKTAPASDVLTSDQRMKSDQGILTGLPDRSKKAKAPEPLVPTNRYGSPEGSLKHFEETRATTVAFLNDTPELRGHAADTPLGMKMDLYEWVLTIAGHSERHTKQILEVKADPNFPKN
jgi:hypothetical protein